MLLPEFYSLYNDIYQSLKNDFKTLAKVSKADFECVVERNKDGQ